MDFKKITIPYAGREKYPSNGTGASIKTIISNYIGAGAGGGGSIPGGNNNNNNTGGNDNENRGGLATASFCFLSKTSSVYSALDLAQGSITDPIFVLGYKDNSQAQTLIGDISVSSSTQDYSIIGIPESGMAISVTGNGTTGATINIVIDSSISEDSGTLTIPVAINISDNSIDPYHEVWYENSSKCNTMNLQFSWTINRAATGSYILDLSNQTAGVNCDSAGTLYVNSIATLQCTATTYYNGAVATGISYSASTLAAYGATGFSVDANTGAFTFNTAGTIFYWSTAYPSLPIDIIAYKDGEAIATKTMTISRNYPGTDGTPAHTRYIVTDADVVRFDPNTSAYTPDWVTGRVMLQVGDLAPIYDSSTTIYVWYNDLETGKSQASGSISASTAYNGIDKITFALKNSQDEYYEIEEVPVIKEGVNGTDGEPGQPGEPGESGESAWYLTLSNDNASINCDSDGNILPGAVRPSCQAKLYYGGEIQSSATYIVNTGGATGVTTGVSSGILTLYFGNNFNFTGTSLSISITGRTNNVARDIKVMTVSKSIAGAPGTDGDDGEDAVTYWLEPSFGEIIYNPNTQIVSPNTITCSAYKQIGQGEIQTATDVVIKYQWENRNNSTWTNETTYSTAIIINQTTCTTYRRLRFKAYVGSTCVDTEDVDIIIDGTDGQPGPSGNSVWYLTLSNDNASINCDSDGNILPGAVRPTCTAKLYYGTEKQNIVTYVVDYGSATGVTTSVTSGNLSITFGANFNFTGTVLNISITGKTNNIERDAKVMTITKSIAGTPGTDGTDGDDGEDAMSYWLDTSYGEVIFNPNTSAVSPTSISCTAYKQIGQGAIQSATDVTIKYQWENRTTGQWSYETTYTGAVSITSGNCVSYRRLRFKGYVGNTIVDQEDVDILVDGTNGTNGSSGDSAWYLTLSNDNASINCDSDGNILPGAVRPSCQAKLYYGNERQTAATYSVNTGGATGITSGVSSGILTLTFGTNFNFTGTVLNISISGRTGNVDRDVKTMTITKSIAGAPGTDGTDGEDGEDAVTYWLEPSFGEVIYDPNTRTPSPNSITCAVYKQIGQGAVQTATDATIKYCWQNRSNGNWTTETNYTNAITVTSGNCVSYSRLRFRAYVGSTQVDQEDIDIMNNGTNGTDGTSGNSVWYLTLTNDNASINCDSDGNILPGAVKPSCQAKLYYGTDRRTDATFSVNTGGATGVTTSVTSGILTLTFGNNFNFTGSVLSINITGRTSNTDRDVKVMTITKSIAGTNGTDGTDGEDGEDAVTYWLETSYDDVMYDPNTRTPSPNSITCAVYKQIGQGAIQQATDATIKYQWQYRSNSNWTSESNYSSSVSVTSGNCETYRRLRFNAYVGTVRVDYEDVDILSNGTDGQPGSPGYSGISSWHLSLSNDNASINCDSNGNILPGAIRPNCELRLYYGETLQRGGTSSFDISTWYDGTTQKSSTSGLVITTQTYGALLTITTGFSFTSATATIYINGRDGNGNIRDTKAMNITKSYAGTNGTNGNTPYIGSNGNWWIGSTDTGVKAEGEDGQPGTNGLTPYIGQNGNWWIGNTDTGVKAEGTDGNTPYIGQNGNWWIGNTDTGVKAEGEDGDTPYIGSNGNWWIGNTDTGVKAEGVDGDDAVSYWLTPTYSEIIYDRNTNTPSPTQIRCEAYKQVGQQPVAPASDVRIRYQWQYRNTGSWTTESNLPVLGVTITSGNCETYRRLRFIGYINNYTDQVDMEDIDILMDGLDGVPGAQGRRGPAIRGPYNWDDVSGSTRYWCNGESSTTISDSDKWIDVIIKNNVYYYCNTSYYGTLNWSQYSSNWTSGYSFDFIATNLLLAQNAKINFLSGNEIYLMDGNNVTGGLAGGTGITIWSGSDAPANAPFRVDADGGMTATTGNIAGWDLTSSGYSHTGGAGEDYLHSEINHNGIEFDATPAGNNQHFSAGLEGISFTTEEDGVTGISVQGDDMKVIMADGVNSISSGDLKPGINTNMDITGHKNLGLAGLANGLSVKTPAYVKGDMVSVNYSGDTDTIIGYNTAVVSPFTGLKIAVITTGSTYSTYFIKSGGHWVFNGNLDTKIDSSSGGYPYMVQVTSSAVASNWGGMGYPGIPSDWVGMWCACSSNGSSSSYYYYPTGIYGPNHSKKGDTIYFSV